VKKKRVYIILKFKTDILILAIYGRVKSRKVILSYVKAMIYNFPYRKLL